MATVLFVVKATITKDRTEFGQQTRKPDVGNTLRAGGAGRDERPAIRYH